MSKLKSGRLILDEGAIAALSSMYEEMKNQKCIKITPSKLGSWIISEFYKSYFPRYKSKIAKEHFNTKEYLKNIVSNIDESDDIEVVLKSTLMELSPRKSKLKRANKEESESSTEA
jgi:CHAT domain-containing protein